MEKEYEVFVDNSRLNEIVSDTTNAMIDSIMVNVPEISKDNVAQFAWHKAVIMRLIGANNEIAKRFKFTTVEKVQDAKIH